eukprot:1190115-Prorocentrum_minimum.AAC.1
MDSFVTQKTGTGGPVRAKRRYTYVFVSPCFVVFVRSAHRAVVYDPVGERGGGVHSLVPPPPARLGPPPGGAHPRRPRRGGRGRGGLGGLLLRVRARAPVLVVGGGYSVARRKRRARLSSRNKPTTPASFESLARVNVMSHVTSDDQRRRLRAPTLNYRRKTM